MTTRLDVYLALERVMLFAESKQQDATADGVRDVMDQLWYSFDEAERRLLDMRTVGTIEAIEGIKLPPNPLLFFHPPAIIPVPFPQPPIEGWRLAA